MAVVVSVFQRRVAGIALVAFLLGLGLPFVGPGHLGFNGDDSACGSDLFPGFDRPTQVQTAAAAVPLEHCAICHLQRAASSASPAAPLAWIRSVGRADVFAVEDSQPVASAARDRQPARAPPSSLHS